MMVGTSPLSFRDKAKAFLANAKDSAVVQQQADALRLRDAEIDGLKQQMQELLGKLNKPEKAEKPAKAT